jgi:tetratricopeptide (TPR) repeat protein
MIEYLFLTYLIGSAVLLGIRWRRDWREWCARFTFAACLPVAGLLLPLFWPARWHARNDVYGRDLQPDIFRHEAGALAAGTGIFLKPQSEKEMNVVPLEEALLVNDLVSRRRMMIDLLKQDSLEYLEVLGMAVSNDDTETSHYAVSAIVEVKRKLTLSLQELAVKYEEEKHDPYFLLSYSSVLKSYMRSGFIDDRTLLKHKHAYSNLLNQLLEVDPDATDAYEDKINIDLELGEYATALVTAKQYYTRYPNKEGPYLALMKVYYTMRSFDQLQAVIENLKRSTVRLSSQSLSIARYWMEASKNA